LGTKPQIRGISAINQIYTSKRDLLGDLLENPRLNM